jgi:hypothetical protein
MINFATTSFLFALLLANLCPLAQAQSANQTSSSNVVCELQFKSTRDHRDPFNDLTLDVSFTDPTGTVRRVPAFWAGGNVWKVRYASDVVGTHAYRTECSDASDSGLNGVSGKIEVVPYTGSNPLYLHGPIRIAADHRHFEHPDGTPLLWLGDTWWMGLSKRLVFPEEFATLVEDRQKKGFNVIQIVAGLYPDQGAFDPRGANEAGFPWEKDYARIRPEYFDAADRRIEYLVEHRFAPCIVGAWGYHLPWLGEAKMKQHLRYLAARWGAMPVVWCAAGEFDLPWYLSKGFPRLDGDQAKQWAEAIRYFRDVNAFGRPITAHPTGIPPLSARMVLRDVAKEKGELLDFDMLQTGHGGRGVLAPTISTLRSSLALDPPEPVVNGEVAYEALLGKIPAEIPRLICWACLLSGAAGHTYGANGVWQLNREGDPYGKSPHGGTYGPIPWNQAMRLPGSAQVGFAAKLLRENHFEKFEPHQEWAEFGKPTADKFLVPYAAGIPGAVRIIYVPVAEPIVLKGLRPRLRVTGQFVDPVSCTLKDATFGDPDESGTLLVPRPSGIDHDWALVLAQPTP